MSPKSVLKLNFNSNLNDIQIRIQFWIEWNSILNRNEIYFRFEINSDQNRIQFRPEWDSFQIWNWFWSEWNSFLNRIIILLNRIQYWIDFRSEFHSDENRILFWLELISVLKMIFCGVIGSNPPLLQGVSLEVVVTTWF